MNTIVFEQYKKLDNDKSRINLLINENQRLTNKINELAKNDIIHLIRETNKNLMINHIWYQLPGEFLTNNNLSYFMDNCYLANYNDDTLLYNENFTFYRYKDENLEKGYYFDVIKICTKKYHKTFNDIRHYDYWALFNSIKYLLEKNFIINDLKFDINSNKFMEYFYKVMNII